MPPEGGAFMKALPDRLARIFYVIGGLLFLLLLIGVTCFSSA